jgi:hypothetical protein
MTRAKIVSKIITNADLDGDLDVDGTTNLDVVDIDGAVDFASTTAHAGNATFADNAKGIFGAGSDLQIYHDGSNSYIDEQGTGDLYIRTTATLRLQNASGTNYIYGTNGGEVALYHNGNGKLFTTSTGIQVTGNMTNTSGNFLSTSAANSYIIVNGNENAVAAVANGAVSLYHDNVEKLTTTSYGTYTTGQMRTDTGVGFGAAAANLLSDYEEGTFVPKFTFGGASAGQSYSSVRNGFYTKIGRVVYVTIRLELSARGSSTGTIRIADLPFALPSTSNLNYSFYIGYVSGVGALFDSDNTYLVMDAGENKITLRRGNGGNSQNIGESNFGNSSQMIVSGFYHTA